MRAGLKRSREAAYTGLVLSFFLLLGLPGSIRALSLLADYNHHTGQYSIRTQDYPALTILENIDRGFSAEIICHVAVDKGNGPFSKPIFQETRRHRASWDRLNQCYMLRREQGQQRFEDPFALMDHFFSFQTHRFPESLYSSAGSGRMQITVRIVLHPVKLSQPLHIIYLLPGTPVTPLRTKTKLFPRVPSP